MNDKMEMTPSRRLKAKLFVMLNAAEQGGMSPTDCGSILDAVTACWSGLNAEQITRLNNSLAEIESIPDGNAFELGAYRLSKD